MNKAMISASDATAHRPSATSQQARVIFRYQDWKRKFLLTLQPLNRCPLLPAMKILESSHLTSLFEAPLADRALTSFWERSPEPRPQTWTTTIHAQIHPPSGEQ